MTRELHKLYEQHTLGNKMVLPIHVHVMACQIQRDEELEDDAVCWLRSGQEDEQAGCGASIRHHVQHGAESRALLVFPRSDSIGGVK